MDPYRKSTISDEAARPPSDERALGSSCAIVRAPADGPAFLSALLGAWPDLEVLQDTKVSDIRELRRAFVEAPVTGLVLTVVGLATWHGETLCIDPSRSWWSEGAMMARLSATLGRVVCAIVDVPFAAFGVRWFERGTAVRKVLIANGHFELEGPTVQDEVGFDIGKLDAATARAVARLPDELLLEHMEPVRVILLRDHAAESLLGAASSR